MIVQQGCRWPTCDIIVEKTTIDTLDTYTSPATYFSADDTNKIFGGFIIPDFEDQVLYWYYVGGTWNDETDRLEDIRARVRTAPMTGRNGTYYDEVFDTGSGGDTEPSTTDIVKAVLYNSYNSAVKRLFKALKSIKELYNRLS